MSFMRVCLFVLVCGAEAALSGTASQPAKADPLKKVASASALPPGCLRQLGEVRVLNAGRVLSAAFAPDGKTLAAGSWDSTVYLWDVATGKEIRRLAAQDGLVNVVAFSRDGTTLASNGMSGTLRLWEAATGKLRARQCPDQIFAARLAPNGRTLAAHTWQGFYLWDMTTGKSVAGNRPLDVPMGFTPDSKRIIFLSFVGESWMIVVRDAESGKEIGQLATGQESPGPNALAQDGKKLLFTRGSRLFVYDLGTGRMRQQSRSPDRSLGIESLAFSNNGKMLAVQGTDEVVHVWETASLGERCRFQGRENGKVPLAFSPDGTVLASGSTDSTVLLWDVPGIRSGRISSGELARKELAGLWKELANADASRAYRAMARMMAAPGAALAFLKEQLPPAAVKIDGDAVARLLKNLASDKFLIREKAGKELANFGEPAEPLLQKALSNRSELEVRRRVQRVLDGIDEERSHPSPERLRIMRAVEVVEAIGGQAARKLLTSWAKGTPAVLLTREAQAALSAD
jgi:hypothetical protein